MARRVLFFKTLCISGVVVFGVGVLLGLAGYIFPARVVSMTVGFCVSVLALWLLFKAWDRAPNLSAVGAFYALRVMVEFGAVIVSLFIPAADPIGVLIPQLFGLPILAILMAIEKEA
ncbi:hypothetical protein [uncultured Ruthenibacterium sp.]|uniref:hypothetical protein n=1 Tax=uncultured Ruthenibacterium sp. TaxID=1905347 RepID=UPI00349EDAAB